MVYIWLIHPEHVSERKTVYGEDNYGSEFSDERDLSKFLEDDAQAGVLKVTATTWKRPCAN